MTTAIQTLPRISVSPRLHSRMLAPHAHWLLRIGFAAIFLHAKAFAFGIAAVA